jgi:hypothetical protein
MSRYLGAFYDQDEERGSTLYVSSHCGPRGAQRVLLELKPAGLEVGRLVALGTAQVSSLIETLEEWSAAHDTGA